MATRQSNAVRCVNDRGINMRRGSLALMRWMRFRGGTDGSSIGSGACFMLDGALPLPCDCKTMASGPQNCRLPCESEYGSTELEHDYHTHASTLQVVPH